jgi:undecaprenyl-diphosphatase
MSKEIKIFLLIILLAGFLAVCWLVATKNPQLLSFDNSVINYFDSLRFPALDTAMLAITKIGDTYESVFIFLVCAIILVAKKKKLSFYIFTIATALASVLPLGLKIIFARTRPVGGLLNLTDYSFPSGHATISAVFLISAILLFAPLIKNHFWRWVFAVAATILLFLVAASRIFLWVHWPSDVLAGLLLGSICYLFANIVCCHKNENML